MGTFPKATALSAVSCFRPALRIVLVVWMAGMLAVGVFPAGISAAGMPAMAASSSAADSGDIRGQTVPAMADGSVREGRDAAGLARATPEPPGAGRVILVVINGLSMDDVAGHPRWRALASEGWLAGMTLKTARGHGDVHQMVTLGAGAYAAGHKDVIGYDADERVEEAGGTAADWFAQLTGRRRTEGVLVPSIALLKKENEKTGRFPAAPGTLGRLIREAGGRTAVFGNGDRGTVRKRLAPLMTMDEDGWSPVGEVGPGMLRAAPERPFGVAADYERMLARFRRLPPDVRLAAFELGDLDRLAAAREKMDESRARWWRQRILAETADFVRDLMRSMDDDDVLWVISPMVDEAAYGRGMWLAPVLRLQRGADGGGLLYSDGTRRAGIVTNVDVTATLLDQLGIPRPAGMGGIPLQTVGMTDGYWRELERLRWAHEMRPLVLRPYVIGQIGLLLVAAVVWGLRLRRWYRPLRLFLLAMLFAPTVLLVVSAPQAEAWHILLLVWAVPLLAAWLTERVSLRFALLAAAAGVWLAVAADLIRGGIWLKRSLLSYDPMLAARFYGIGNEYMGIVVGAVIVTAVLAWEWAERTDRRRWFRPIRWAVPLGMLAWLTVMAAPAAGANAGGAVTAGVGFVGTWMLLRRPGLSPGRLASAWLAGCLLAVGMLLLLNGSWAPEAGVDGNGGASHVGKALTAAGEGQWEGLRAMAMRKLETNWRLIRHSIWTKVFATALVVSFIVQLLPGRSSGRGPFRPGEHPAWTAAFRGILAASVAALLFNDSGIVAAATASVYLVVSLLVLAMNPEDGSKELTG